MNQLTVSLGERSYDIHIGPTDWDVLTNGIAALLVERRAFVIADARVAKLHGAALKKRFGKKIPTEWILVSGGEKNKTLSTVETILTKLSRLGATRHSLIIAFGGGVVGDIAGFVAAIYMRGVRYVQIPTTLLAQVDSSVGGKTGVDLVTGKNLAGAFHQPRGVFILTDFLKTLPEREFRCGLAEVIKYGIIADARFFDFLEKNRRDILRRKNSVLREVITRSCAIKAQVVSQDEREAGVREILNFGHTFGHAIEALTGFSKIKHGEAVAMGMLFACSLATARGIFDAVQGSRIATLIKFFGLPLKWPHLSATHVIAAMGRDKKARADTIRFILPQELGSVTSSNVSAEELVSCLQNGSPSW